MCLRAWGRLRASNYCRAHALNLSGPRGRSEQDQVVGPEVRERTLRSFYIEIIFPRKMSEGAT